MQDETKFVTSWPQCDSLLTTGNSNGLTDLHTLLLTTAHTKSQSVVVFTGWCLAADPNSVLFCTRYKLATASHLTHSSKCQLSTHD
jgi:hypothetical protein